MDHRISKDMISSGMTPSGKKAQEDLGRTQYGSVPSPSKLMDAYRSMYEHHKKDADGNTIPHEGEELNEGKMPEGLKNYLMKKKGKKEDKKDMKEENLDERRGSSVQQLAQNRKDAFKQKVAPQRGMGGGTGNPTNKRGSGAKPNPFSKPATPPQKGYGGGVGNPTQKRGSGLISRIASKIGSLMNSDVDLFDLVKGELIDEGYEEKEALKIMINLSEDQLNELLGGRPGDGYIGHPNLKFKNPFSKQQIKKPVMPNAKGGGLLNKTAGQLGDRKMELQKLMKGM